MVVKIVKSLVKMGLRIFRVKNIVCYFKFNNFRKICIKDSDNVYIFICEFLFFSYFVVVVK